MTQETQLKKPKRIQPEFYCSINKPINARYGTVEECTGIGQVKYWGQNAVPADWGKRVTIGTINDLKRRETYLLNRIDELEENIAKAKLVIKQLKGNNKLDAIDIREQLRKDRQQLTRNKTLLRKLQSDIENAESKFGNQYKPAPRTRVAQEAPVSAAETVASGYYGGSYNDADEYHGYTYDDFDERIMGGCCQCGKRY